MKSKTVRILCGVGAAASGGFAFLLTVNSIVSSMSINAAKTFFNLMIGNTLTQSNTVDTLLWFALTAAFSALCSGLTWLTQTSRQKAIKTSSFIAFVLCIAVLFDELAVLPLVGIALGSFGCIGCILLYGWLQKKLPAVFNRETISYIVFGVLTTVVSFVSQMLFSAAGFPVIVNTIGSWVCAVLFAYVVNKLFVFESKTDSAKAFWRELGLFIGARVASLGMELVFMFVTVELLHFSEAVCKLIAQIFILIANYVLSKLIIFKKN